MRDPRNYTCHCARIACTVFLLSSGIRTAIADPPPVSYKNVQTNAQGVVVTGIVDFPTGTLKSSALPNTVLATDSSGVATTAGQLAAGLSLRRTSSGSAFEQFTAFDLSSIQAPTNKVFDGTANTFQHLQFASFDGYSVSTFSLTDPNADRIAFWDDSKNTTGGWEWLTVGSGLTLSGTTLTATTGAPTDATYITQTANGTLSAEQALSSLSTGLMKVTTSTGVITSIVPGTGVEAALAVANNSAGGYSPIDGTATLSNKTLTAPKVAILKPASDSTTAIQITKADGTTAVGTWDTSGSNLTVANNLTVSGGTFNLGATTSAITGGAGNMTITSGTGNSRTMALRTTTSGGTATTALTLGADQGATFAGQIAANMSALSSGRAVIINGGTGMIVQNSVADDSGFLLYTGGGDSSIRSSYTSTGSYKPMTFYTSNAEVLRLNTDGTIQGGASNMSITSGTGNSRTMTLKTTTSGGTATNAQVWDASQNTQLTGKVTSYNSIVTEGNGMGAIVKATRVTTQSSAGTIATYTTPSADGSYLVSGNINVTAAIALSTSLNCDYTDETNTARTMIIPITGLAGAFVAGGLATTTGPFESTVIHIRTKASTAITISTAAGTFTSVTYNAEGVIRQLQ